MVPSIHVVPAILRYAKPGSLKPNGLVRTFLLTIPFYYLYVDVVQESCIYPYNFTAPHVSIPHSRQSFNDVAG